MNPGFQQIGIGVLAGLATALLSIGLASGSALGSFAYFLSAFPLMAAGLGWGFVSAATAALSAAAFAGFSVSPSFAIVIAMSTLLPALVGVWYFALARPADEIGGPAGKLAWFPLADTLLRMAVAVAAGFIIIGAIIGYDEQFVRGNIGALVERMRQIDPQFQPAAGFEDQMTSLLTVVLPFFQTGFWFATLTANLYLAARLTRMSGRFGRPADNWPQTLRLPKPGLAALAVTLALAFVPGAAGHVGAAIAGAIGAGFIMAGLARVHWVTAGKPTRILLLWIAYAAALFFLPALIVLLIAGLFDTSRHVPISDPANTKPSST